MKKEKSFSLNKFYWCLFGAGLVVFVACLVLSLVFVRPTNTYYHDHDGDKHYIELCTKEKFKTEGAFVMTSDEQPVKFLEYEDKNDGYYIFSFESEKELEIWQVSIFGENGFDLELEEYPENKENLRDAIQTTADVLMVVGFVMVIVSVVQLIKNSKHFKNKNIQEKVEEED